MNRADIAGVLAGVGIFLLVFGVGGSVPLDTPIVGDLLGLPRELSFRLAGAGVLLLVLVAVGGTIVKRTDL